MLLGGLIRLLVSSLFSRLGTTYHEVMGLSSRKKRSSLTTNNFGRSSLLVFMHEVEEFCFLFKVEDRADFHPVFLSVDSLQR